MGAAEDPIAAPVVEGSNVITAPPLPASVLVVDDGVTNRLVLELMLVKLGAKVRCVASILEVDDAGVGFGRACLLGL